MSIQRHELLDFYNLGAAQFYLWRRFGLQSQYFVVFRGSLDVTHLLQHLILDFNYDFLQGQLLVVAHLDNEALVILNKHFVKFFENKLLCLII